MSTFGYCRASKKKQIESPEVQKETIGRYVEFNQLEDVRYFVDASSSGKIAWDERPAGQELFRQVKDGDHVIISRLDRAFRRLDDCVQALERFRRMGVRLHICSMLGGAIDLSSPMGVFLIHILAAFAELERAFISERTKDGLSLRKKAGVRHTNYAPYGKKWVKKVVQGRVAGVLVDDEEEREVMRNIVMWRMQDEPLSWAQIADHLAMSGIKTRDGRIWHDRRIRRAFKEELRIRMRERGKV